MDNLVLLGIGVGAIFLPAIIAIAKDMWAALKVRKTGASSAWRTGEVRRLSTEFAAYTLGLCVEETERWAVNVAPLGSLLGPRTMKVTAYRIAKPRDKETE